MLILFLDAFRMFLRHCKDLAFEQEPDYNYLRTLLDSVALSSRISHSVSSQMNTKILKGVIGCLSYYPYRVVWYFDIRREGLLPVRSQILLQAHHRAVSNASNWLIWCIWTEIGRHPPQLYISLLDMSSSGGNDMIAAFEIGLHKNHFKQNKDFDRVIANQSSSHLLSSGNGFFDPNTGGILVSPKIGYWRTTW